MTMAQGERATAGSPEARETVVRAARRAAGRTVKQEAPGPLVLRRVQGEVAAREVVAVVVPAPPLAPTPLRALADRAAARAERREAGPTQVVPVAAAVGGMAARAHPRAIAISFAARALGGVTRRAALRAVNRDEVSRRTAPSKALSLGEIFGDAGNGFDSLLDESGLAYGHSPEGHVLHMKYKAAVCVH